MCVCSARSTCGAKRRGMHSDAVLTLNHDTTLGYYFQVKFLEDPGISPVECNNLLMNVSQAS